MADTKCTHTGCGTYEKDGDTYYVAGLGYKTVVYVKCRCCGRTIRSYTR